MPLVSSEYAYPYRLQSDNFFNITNLTDTLFAGEVPPAEMRVLLRDVWGLGPELSDVFLAYYGGHVHLASQALTKLAATLDNFNCKAVAPKGAAGAIARCLEADASGDTRKVLHAMALRGFAPVAHEGNAQAQALAHANLGGLIDTDATVIGLPRELRTGENFGIVPSSNFIVSVVWCYMPLRPPPLNSFRLCLTSPHAHQRHPFSFHAFFSATLLRRLFTASPRRIKARHSV